MFSYKRTWDCTQFYFFVWLSVFWCRFFPQLYVILLLSLKKLMSLSWKLTCKLVECQNADEDGAGSPCYLEDENGDMDLNRPQVCKIIHFRLTSFIWREIVEELGTQRSCFVSRTSNAHYWMLNNYKCSPDVVQMCEV